MTDKPTVLFICKHNVGRFYDRKRREGKTGKEASAPWNDASPPSSSGECWTTRREWRRARQDARERLCNPA